MGLTKTCQSREPRATSIEADANARHAVPAVLWTTPFRQLPTSRFHATASMTVGKARMSRFIANAMTAIVRLVKTMSQRDMRVQWPLRRNCREQAITLVEGF